MRASRFAAIAAVTALTIPLLFLGGPAIRSAKASLVAKAAMMTALVAEVEILIRIQKSVNEERDTILESTQNLQNRAITEQRFDTTMYAHDHRALSANRKIDPAGITNTLSSLYTELTGAGSVSFASGGDYERFLTGRTGPTSGSDFHKDYRERAESLSKYAVGVMKGNDMDSERMVRYQADALKPMTDALFAGDDKDKLKNIWKDEHDKMDIFHSKDLPYSAAEPNGFKDFDNKRAFLGDKLLTGPGYRRTIQASGQISNLKNHLMVSARAGLARGAEAGVKYAHNEQRERAETHFAFERAVGSWHSAGGTGY